MDAKYKLIGIDERLKIEALYSEGFPITEIARRLGRNYYTIYKEIRRGCVDRRDKYGRRTYQAEHAHQMYLQGLSRAGRKPKGGSENEKET